VPVANGPEVALSSRQVPEEAIRDLLPRLRQQLASEYGTLVSADSIDRAAEDALGELEGARIRDFVPLLAWRRARARLRQAS
jgi:Protein of unknown function (DUF3562)